MKKFIKNIVEEKVIGAYLKKFHYDIKGPFRDNDVFIVGYPKSGNTWMQNIIAGLLFGIDTKFLPDRLTQELVPPVKNKRFFKRFLDFNCFKSHELPTRDYKRVILLVRDGRDVIPSYKSMNDKQGIEFSIKQMVIEGKGLYPNKWHEFYKAWLSNPYQSEILILKYEDLIQDGFEQLKKICKFLNIDRDDQSINKVLEGNSFENMKVKQKTFGYDGRSLTKNQNFFRSGKAGAYHEDFDQDLLLYFENESMEILKTFNYI